MPCSKELAAICVITPIRKDNFQDNEISKSQFGEMRHSTISQESKKMIKER